MVNTRRSQARAVASASVLMVVALIFQQGICYSPIRVYHYTNKAGYDGIVRSDAIRPSDIKQGDAYYGRGVYCTKLDPSTPIFQVLTNNYGLDGGFHNRGADKMDRADYVFVFEVDLDKDNVTVVTDTKARSVLIIGGGRDVSLETALDFGMAQVVSDSRDSEQADQEFERWLRSFFDWSAHKRFLNVVAHVLLMENSSLSLSFLHMGQLDFTRFTRPRFFGLQGATPEQLAAKFSWVERTDDWAWSADGSFAFHDSFVLNFTGFDYVVMVVWKHGENGEKTVCRSVPRPIAFIGPWMVERRAEWTEQLHRFTSLAPKCKAVTFFRRMLYLITDKAC
ncbi:unnamed protein product [Symbiodinium natans]|uniref:Uncharacterized protein n=1 Tax=Symbiodinium natans TaxID=878477 RepID=A0A812S1V2_9DINO|nr:unnamed protein product [Symbiodinium natans]